MGKMNKCLFRSTCWSTVSNLCNLSKLNNLKGQFPFEYNLQNEEMTFKFTLCMILPLSICVICANCTICHTAFNWTTICPIKKYPSGLHLVGSYHYQLAQFVLILTFARRFNNLCAICRMKKCLSDLLFGGSYSYRFVSFVQIAPFARRVSI